MKFSESETTELKAIYTEEIKKEVIAFANTNGGHIYIGIEDDGNIIGTENSDFVIQQISNSLRDSIKPDVTMFINYEIKTIDNKSIVHINVQSGTHKPYYLSNKGLRPEGVYVRQGTSSVPASDMMIRLMIKETDGDNYEDMRSLNQALTFEKLKIEFDKRNIIIEEPQMRTLGIIDNNGIYSNLALLLSDQCPHIIKAATFNGVNNQNFQDRMEFSGSLLKQLEDAYAYIELRNNNFATFEGLLRIDNYSYPKEALREALLNAIVHRDYSLSAPTLLSIYSDRMEFTSIGGLAGISYDDMMLGISYCRNKKLADVFYELKLIESYGIGIPKIMSSYNQGDAKPKIQVSTGAFKITLPNKNFNKNETVSIEEKLCELFKKHKKLKRSDVEQLLEISTSTARRLLKKSVESGNIESIGSGRNIIYKLK